MGYSNDSVWADKIAGTTDTNFQNDGRAQKAISCCQVIRSYLKQENLNDIMEIMKFSMGSTLPKSYKRNKESIEKNPSMELFPSSRYLSFFEDGG